MENILSIDPKNETVGTVHGHLLSAISPRPIAFASTVDAQGRPNLSPFSFFNVFGANPPIVIFSPARRVRGNTTKHTLENAKEVDEVVINIVNYNMVQQMSLSSTEYAEGVNEFEKAGLTMLKSDLVKPFRVAESPVQLECKVKQIVETGTEGGAGNLIICEVVKIHINKNVLDENGSIDQHKIDTVARMGGNWYSRANMGMFEVEKPLRTLGIGVDNLPQTIRESKILTGNDLGRLGNVETLPTKELIEDYIIKNSLGEFVKNATVEDLHKQAKQHLENNNTTNAWYILLAK
ncbi:MULTISPECIES: flavin reductase family protein [Croceibacter]|jgi:flavin reductase (DIM6/NTAB) family NADH-FMN oxidoreductase RutF|uniref:flavin reductase family protein n=1 Tax=Croceibacter TaxID=216431 RepID=UPI000C46C08A|nr:MULTISPECIES: flavin reductase family protein [Croceibacter]MBG25874.1 flavin reductase [Croceibacter sp.]HAT69290.1 flavin reductase [Flavobacteriaceae bacterium]|tara:strand:+ start:78551 stop:79429 length:879 start_codon:yes stop_codon:yes gene_type:complete